MLVSVSPPHIDIHHAPSCILYQSKCKLLISTEGTGHVEELTDLFILSLRTWHAIMVIHAYSIAHVIQLSFFNFSVLLCRQQQCLYSEPPHPSTKY